MRKALIISGLMLCSFWGKAQDFSKAYERAYQQLVSQENIAYQMRYLSRGANTVVDESSLYIEKIGDQSYSKMGKLESYLLDSTSVVIDHEQESILLNVGVQVPDLSTGLDRIALIEQLEQEAVRRTVDSTSEWVQHNLWFQEQNFKKLSVSFSKATGNFQRIVFYPAKPIENYEEVEEEAVVAYEVLFENYQTNLQDFSTPLSNYLQFNEGKYSLQSTYSNYQFVTNYDVR